MRVLPVYNLAVCVSKSTHAGALPGPAYPYVDHHRSTDLHDVSWIPGPWCKQTKQSILGDGLQIVLSGHDTGMMIPHVSPIMDNLMLPVTLISSSCTWPFESFRKCAEKQPMVAFFPALAPFIYCDDPETPEKSGGKGKGTGGGDAAKPSVVKVNSDKLQKRKVDAVKATNPSLASLQQRAMTPRLTLDGAMTRLPSTRGVRHVQAEIKSARQALQRISAKSGIQKLDAKIGIQVNGRGRIYIPPASTILLGFNFAELAMGWAKVIISKGLDAAAGAMLKPLRSNARDSLKRLDDDVALAVGSWSQRRQAAKDLYATIARETVWKAGADSIKSRLLDGKVKVPYGVFSYDFHKGKGSFLWWGSFESAPRPEAFPGFRSMGLEALKLCYNPAVEELVRDNPNYAAASAGEK